MEYGAIDLHKQRSVIRIINEQGTVILDRRIDTTRDAFAKLFGGRARMRVLLESSTESEWVAQCVEALGHEVVVADPNYTLMYGARSRKIKTDRRDVAALAEACRTGIYRPAYRRSAAGRELRQTLRVRRQLVTMRTDSINLLRAVLRQEGVRLPSGHAESVLQRLARVTVPAAVRAVLAPLMTTMEAITRTLTALDDELAAQARGDATTRCLMTAPGVGPIVALTFQAVVDDPARFAGAGPVTAYLGLVPSEYSSAERRHRGRITKRGSGEVRAMLIQACWNIWRSRGSLSAGLRAWVHALAARRGRQIAIVALARRLARALYAMWRDHQPFTPSPRHAMLARAAA